MGSISLEAFDASIRNKYTLWILPSDICILPNGFQDQVLSGTPSFQMTILLMSKQDSKAWLLSYPWDLTYIPESNQEWSLLLSILSHLKKPILIVATPQCKVPPAFWHKCQSMSVTSIYLCDSKSEQVVGFPFAVFFPKLDVITDTQFTSLHSILPPAIQQSIQNTDLRSLYRELRGAGASLCLSQINSQFITTNASGSMPSYNATWFYPENNAALRLHISDLQMILRTVTERLTGP
jgi:hypothetical protein